MKRKLPIGIQTFREIREDGFYYVDKTMFARNLVEEGKLNFLSRPRRFGKSLFLDTLKELFEGNEALFQGLHIHDKWDWTTRYPVVRLHFGAGDFTNPDHLTEDVLDQLATLEAANAIPPSTASAPFRFRRLVGALREQSGQRVAVLVDEYDKPILDALGTPAAAANRQFLRGLYAVIKQSDAHIKFAFLTGVSKFSKVSLFSDLNNLKDITLNRRYAAICGYTEQDMDTVFAEELAGLDRNKVRRWYNGYSWRGSGYTTPSTFCCCSTSASSERTGSRPDRRSSSSTNCAGAGCHPFPWRACSRTTTCSPPSTWKTWQSKHCCSRPATSPSPTKNRMANAPATASATPTKKCA